MKLDAAYSTISAASITTVVDEQYAIGPLARCSLLRRGFNDSYAMKGADGRRYIARLSKRRFRGPANADYETELLTHLHRSGITVGAPVADRDGRLWNSHDAPEGPREFVLFERLSGRELIAAVRRAGKPDEQTLTDVQALGASLARIHVAGEGFEGPPSLYRIEGSDLLDAPLAQIVGVVDGDLGETATALGDKLRTRLHERAAALSIGHCHGDNHAGNTLIADAADGTLVPGWFDFDDGGPGFLAYDLATFLWSLLLRTPSGEMNEDVPPFWRAFIGGYRSARPIRAADLKSIGLLVAVRQIWLLGNHASLVPSIGPFPADYFRQGLDLARKWEGLSAPEVE
ncbi:MAG TPA: phosphotransferase [Caulobacteraceae bacterium]|jgi:Ser/Thr protein kinase RdoA (MazF antagonist)